VINTLAETSDRSRRRQSNSLVESNSVTSQSSLSLHFLLIFSISYMTQCIRPAYSKSLVTASQQILSALPI